MKPTIIRASAGTGKTYRLSLEFINLLLSKRVDFKEILVITFTKKATAEIRERIFEHLHNIVYKTDKAQEILKGLKVINPESKFDAEDIEFLKNTYQKMLTNKSEVNISTIDSFINAVFSGVIAPFHNIVNYQIDNNINEEYLPEIYQHILKDSNLKIYEDIFLQAKRRNLEQFNNFIKDVINYRWLFEFIDLSEFSETDIEKEKEKCFLAYKKKLSEFLQLLTTEIKIYLGKKDEKITWDKLIQKNYYELLEEQKGHNLLEADDLYDQFYNWLTETAFIEENYSLLLDDKNLWMGNRIRNPELKSIFQATQHKLAEYLFYKKAINEQFNIISLAVEILKIYDKIKFRDKIFTHSDISYYTFRYLYDPELSIIDNNNILNIFYEQLSYNVRFILIDEFQDTSILQWKIFQPLINETLSGEGQKPYGDLIVVGDEKQAIYGWRGGERRLLADFHEFLNFDVQTDSLKTSYRSKPILMNWINRLFGSEFLTFNNDWNYSNIDSFKKQDGFVQVHFRNREKIEGIQEEKLDQIHIYHEFVNETLLPLIKEGKITLHDTAILMRKNKELEEMATVLDEAGISYTLESSGSLFDHRAIKPILLILKFIVYEDPIELIKFLRSDIVLIHPNELKQILSAYKNAANLDEFFQQTPDDHYLNILQKISIKRNSIVNIVKTIVEEFNITKLFSAEIELKNIHRFLGIAIEFENTNHEHTIDLPGFLLYCRALAEKDEYSQLGQTYSDAIKLLTIHKSKGLQFETVFTLFDVTSTLGRNYPGLKLYYNFADNFRDLQDFALTYNFDKILKKSNKRELVEIVEKRDAGEELNNIYVALTRAKNNLFIYLHYKKQGDLEKFIGEIKDDSSVLKNITKTIFNEFSEDMKSISVIHQIIEYGKITKYVSEEEIQKSATLPFAGKFMELFDWEDISEREQENIHQIKKEFLENKSILTGNIVHFYLSNIDYDNDQNREVACYRTIAKYGSLMHLDKVQVILEKTNNFIKENIELFSKENWDRVFNEYSVFNAKGKEFRIDRMMVNSRKKEILIIDYKTGAHYEEEQLDKYKEIIEKLPIVINKNYSVKTKFVEVRI
ncbi:MAG: UvrD-helicase domain-containing protein [Candidatus Cloacimonetes bacterium]|nr:UvrD-helicase domain-containing protein [Candidatus Cloacimonadota bacterium]